jgi:shikimate kinase
MKLLISLIVIFASSLSINAGANELIFKCSTQNKKSISIYQDGDSLTYKFGKENSKPDMDLTKNKDQLNITQEIPVGTGLNSSVEFKNGIYSYTINESLNRVSDEHEASAWLDVSKNKDIISSIDCNIDYGSLSYIN